MLNNGKVRPSPWLNPEALRKQGHHAKTLYLYLRAKLSYRHSDESNRFRSKFKYYIF